MFRKLRADEIDCRVAVARKNGCSILLYKDARVDMNILDEQFGIFGWERKHEIIDGRLYCTVSVYDQHMDAWVSKQDVGTESYTEKEKGQASDSFKRACFNWGIGRELYTAPFIWISSTQTMIEKRDNGSYNVKDSFRVSEIGYDESGKINRLVIKNKGDNIVYSMGTAEEKKEEKQPEEKQVDVTVERITEKEARVLEQMIGDRKKMKDSVLKRYGIESLSELTKVQCAEVHEVLRAFNESLQKAEELKEKCDAHTGKAS